METKFRESGVVAVGQWQACKLSASTTHGAHYPLTLIIQNRILPWMLKVPALLNLWSTPSAPAPRFPAQDIHGLEHDNVWRLILLIILAVANLIEQLRRGKWSDVRGI